MTGRRTIFFAAAVFSRERTDKVRRPGPMMALAAALAAILLPPQAASAHVSERGLVMLLPTGFTTAGAALAVAASFLVLMLAPATLFERLRRWRLVLVPFRPPSRAFASAASLAVLVTLVTVGAVGPTDPGRNLLPLTLWSIVWVGLTLLQALTGNLWPWLNPWTGAFALLRRATGRPIGRKARLPLPRRLRYVPATGFFLAFAWYELVSLSPQDPRGLALAVSLWWLVHAGGIAIFGEAAWMRFAEPFSILYRLIGMLSPLAVVRCRRRPRLALVMPGRHCLSAPPLPPGGTLFLLVTLSSVTFDGFSATFAWLGRLGINPLEFPGRSAVVEANTIGLLAAAALLPAVFLAAVRLGSALAGGRELPAGALVYSIVPISIAFHAAHYLPVLLVNGQFFLAALSDPLGTGADLFGTAGIHVSDSFMTHLDGARRLWTAQTAIIAAGHVVGVVLAHGLALRTLKTATAASRSQLPLAAVMVFYTVFGLWLLSTPVA
ncbi:hypothetical protein [Ensifer soli]|uniref:hypothetical protein n=1 Tax=Ciceribacter sp. sgz301302 TaxID=3342379 RepID=UPI0035B6F8B2